MVTTLKDSILSSVIVWHTDTHYIVLRICFKYQLQSSLTCVLFACEFTLTLFQMGGVYPSQRNTNKCSHSSSSFAAINLISNVQPWKTFQSKWPFCTHFEYCEWPSNALQWCANMCTNTHFMAIFDKKYFTHMICNCKVNVWLNSRHVMWWVQYCRGSKCDNSCALIQLFLYY